MLNVLKCWNSKFSFQRCRSENVWNQIKIWKLTSLHLEPLASMDFLWSNPSTPCTRCTVHQHPGSNPTRATMRALNRGVLMSCVTFKKSIVSHGTVFLIIRVPTQIVFSNSLCFPCPIANFPCANLHHLWLLHRQNWLGRPIELLGKKMKIFVANIAVSFTFRIGEFTTWANKNSLCFPCVLAKFPNSLCFFFSIFLVSPVPWVPCIFHVSFNLSPCRMLSSRSTLCCALYFFAPLATPHVTCPMSIIRNGPFIGLILRVKGPSWGWHLVYHRPWS